VTPTLQSDFIVTIVGSTEPPVALTGTNDTLEAEYGNVDLVVELTTKPQKTYPINFLGTEYPGKPINTRIRYWTQNRTVMVEAPQDAGDYIVEVVLDPVVWVIPNNQAWDGATFDLPFTIKKRTPKSGDFEFSKKTQSEKGNFQSIVITPEPLGIAPKEPFSTAITGSLSGTQGATASTAGVDFTIVRHYAGKDGTGTVYPPAGSAILNTATPTEAGTYTVTFDFNFPADGDVSKNWNALTGIPAEDLVLLPLAPVRPQLDPNDPNPIFWIDNGVLTANPKTFLINPPLGTATCTFTKLPGYEVVEWREDGKLIKTDGSLFKGDSYTFNTANPNTAVGRHWVTLVVKSADGKHYSEDVEIMVQTKIQ